MTTLRDAHQGQLAFHDGNAHWEAVYNPNPPQTGAQPIGAGIPGSPTMAASIQGGMAPSASGIFNEGSAQPHSAANFPVSNPNWAPLWGDQAQGGQRAATTPARAGAAPRTPYGTVSESRTVYEGVAPEFTPPEYKEGEVRKRAKKLAAPALRKMEMAVSQSLSKYYENPNVRSMMVRDTLAGYGMGLGEVLTKAESQAQQQYGAEHSRMFSEAMTKYNAAMQKYAMSARQMQTQRQTYTAAGFEAAASGAPATSVGAGRTEITRAHASLGRY